MKLLALHPIQHDNVYFDKGSFLEMSDEQALPLIERGIAQAVKDEVPVDTGKKIVRGNVKEADKIVPTAAQIEEARQAALNPELDPADQFAKGAIAQSAVVGDDPNRIVDASQSKSRRK